MYKNKSFAAMVKREKYLGKLRNLRDVNVIKVVTGIRRSGKSTLFKQFQEELIASGVKEKNIIYLNLEELENAPLLNAYVLNDYIMKMADKKRKNYVFLDEIQMVSGFERLADSLFVKDFIDLYITGSNAYFLSTDLATLLTGRYIEIPVLPFSFAEFVSGYEARVFDETFDRTFGKSKIEIFNDYLTYGGFPEVSNLLNAGKAQNVKDYLSSVYNTILEKDIMKRNKIRSKFDFENLVKFMFDSVGNIVSPNNIANTMTSAGNKISKETVDNYLSHLIDGFVFYHAQRYDIKGKKLLQTLGKFYAVDLGFLSAIFHRDTQINIGHHLENIVFLELLRRENKINIGKTDDTEVDFVVQTPQGNTEYIQVAWTAKEESTFEREIRPFEKIKDFNRRILLTADVEPATNYKGIQKINVIDWLLNN
ncbi:MAG: ATP-binding protein [Flavobacteriaceae bacterium]|jgi:predicted AAA+ superfamily ATPase|nr:ATP-binding protein [Flavobacteriaceae bacterium]